MKRKTKLQSRPSFSLIFPALLLTAGTAHAETNLVIFSSETQFTIIAFACIIAGGMLGAAFILRKK